QVEIDLTYGPSALGSADEFRVITNLKGVTLTMRPREWLGSAHERQVQAIHALVDSVQKRGWISTANADAVRDATSAQPVHLYDTAGKIVFTEAGVQVQDIVGRVENNWFK